MKQLYTQLEFNNAKGNDKLPLECQNCNKIFFAKKSYIKTTKNKFNAFKYCSRKCMGEYFTNINTKTIKCINCDRLIIRNLYQYNKSKNHFCSRSCAATYNNTHKTYGNRISKLEKWIKEQLDKLYPTLEIHYNKKDIINSELDIYIPSLKLAFELNGIYHYEPIHGPTKLAQIKNNDNRKFQACHENNISLCIIDTSQQNYVKPKTSQKYLDIIINIINSNLNCGAYRN